MARSSTLLKLLLTERHLQSYPAFCREYERVARRIDAALSAGAPGREQYQRWLSGRIRTKPHPDHCRVLERMFPGRTVAELFSLPPDEDASQGSGKGNPTNRRRALKSGAALIAPFLLDKLWSEPNRMHEALDGSSVGPLRLGQLQEEAVDLGVRVVRLPPATLLDQALMRFREVRKLAARKQTLAIARELVRCSAMYATVVGEIMFNEGQFALAGHWYGIARRCADAAGDQLLSDLALAGSAYIPTYCPDPREVLHTVGPRLDGRVTPTPATAWLWGFAAKAHAMLGDRYSFERAIDRAKHVLGQSDQSLIHPGIFSFLPEKIDFYEARGWVELSQVDEASAAAERAIARYDFAETTEPALARFEQASAFVQAGEIQEGCRLATAAVLDRRTYHGVTVVARAKEFTGLIGPSAGQAASEWREVFSSLRQPQGALRGGSDE
ncbi:hypothetical protein EV385_0795 [Krasilnikovia cinnamomea]|uniref:XRE family transcriptional regulator n=1 Tax=Krasilnikovia cinnamomea TaxID=349313 RepID=A0A4Q7ZEB7_9ACTN|nr:hypothetical protein [Krasilnikovia cinnamomea]RZU49060.1 hypothetical protein EV385_0795 [Krasilnikovia cinnamomea]